MRESLYEVPDKFQRSQTTRIRTELGDTFVCNSRLCAYTVHKLLQAPEVSTVEHISKEGKVLSTFRLAWYPEAGMLTFPSDRE